MGKVDRSVPVYPMGIVERLTGLSGRQIRYYEQHKLVSPQRTKGGQRLYSPNDVDRLLQVKELLARGLNLEGVRAWLEEGRGRQPEREPPRAGGELSLPPIDHDQIVTQLQAGRKLTSLFPVNNQAELTRLLESDRLPGGDQPGN